VGRLKDAAAVPWQAATALGVGGALGIITAWVLGFWVEVPNEVSSAIGTIWVFVAGRFIAE
jgi:hypothetical protein